jgi:hypothetical protein
MLDGEEREERFDVAEWAVKSFWIRVAGRNFASRVLAGLKCAKRRERGGRRDAQYDDTGEQVTPARGGTELLA